MAIPDSIGNATSAPFIYDKGTNTIHLGPNGSFHGELHRALPEGSLQGPIYQGRDVGGVPDLWENPGPGLDEQIQRALAEHRGQPYEDSEDDFRVASEVSMEGDPARERTTCDTCGDEIAGVDCPRCSWGGWSNAEDATKNPSDPFRDLKGIQAKTSHTLEWEPGQYGKGYIAGHYGTDPKTGKEIWLGPAVQTWAVNGPDGHPAHSVMGGHEMCFSMDPLGNAEYHAWSETPEMIQRAHKIISEADPRLNFTPDDPDQFKVTARSPRLGTGGSNGLSGSKRRALGQTGQSNAKRLSAPRPPAWQPGMTGKGILDGAGRLHTWTGQMPHEIYAGGRPYHDASAIFYIDPDGSFYGYGNDLSAVAARTIADIDPRLQAASGANDDEDFTVSRSKAISGFGRVIPPDRWWMGS